ncbi:MAG: c-type cytochrome [Pseudomonadota bacterium]
MRNTDRHSSSSFLLVVGIFIGVAVGQTALAAEAQSTPQPAAAPSSQAAPALLSGQQVYKTVCIACHSPPGVGGAPALGNADAWTPRIAHGMDSLIDHALHGFTGSTGVMPRKGERPDLSDEEIIGAVRYMVEQATQ